ncbi:hypothetical protein I308_102943 [Cryptococcus tetragattii IND107]|uniref:Uncharacterized protein n=1 Tax=Cryptococcus tetragattii IND107 TaxID=1296105 RepID=A0ABR3BUU1_9TREE
MDFCGGEGKSTLPISSLRTLSYRSFLSLYLVFLTTYILSLHLLLQFDVLSSNTYISTTPELPITKPVVERLRDIPLSILGGCGILTPGKTCAGKKIKA